MTAETEYRTGDLTGRTLGQYEIGQQLGQGGMATVYLARQKSIGRTVAIKVMPQHFLHDPTFLQRFEHEVKVIAALQHPRVLPVYDYGQIENRPYIVMAYMSGGTLADKIHEGPLPLEQIVKLTEQIAEGLDHAHRKGIIHRDFKPSNVLLDENGNAYLADFGIAKISESTAQLTGSAIIGTPSYMAPEMAEKRDITPAVDVYALGVALFQMLTGQYPFQGDTPIRVMMAHASDPIPDVRGTRPDLPETITAVVNKAMAKRPEDRYTTASDLAKDLQQAAQGNQPPVVGKERHVDRSDSASVEWSEAQQAQPAPAMRESPPSVQSPYVSTPAPMYTTPPPAPQKRGCSPAIIVGSIVGVLVLVCVGVFLAFGGLAVLGSLLSEATATPTIDAPTNASLIIENQSAADICSLYISPETSDQWGNSWLDSGTSILAGETYTIEAITPGTYDLSAVDCRNNTLSEVYGFSMTAGEQKWEVTTELAELTVINNGSLSICELYIVSVDSEGWGLNQLNTDEIIEPGYNFTITDIPAGSYNLKVVTCESLGGAELYDQLLENENEWTISDPEGE
ncbi:MAG: protein kinase [Anaerolineae bacterium]|nr:protein kinase [Anaerolineae bacterium]